MAERTSRGKSQDGFTLLEMVVVVGIVMVAAAIAIPVSTKMIANAKGDSTVVMAATFINSARNRAVSERRNVQMTFTAPNHIKLERIEVPSGTLTIVDEMELEGDEEFLKDPALPDTPDAFGAAAEINFTGVTPVMFTSDGSLIDSAGDVTNGTIFIGRENFPDMSRAITISGVTGMVRSWKWSGGTEWLR